jgi:hypothetical protein
MASRNLRVEDFGQDEFAGKEVKRRKQNSAKGKRSHPAAQSDPLERRRHRWRKQAEREQESGLTAGRGMAALDDEEVSEDDDMDPEPLDFEDNGQSDDDEAWDDEPLSDYDVDFEEDEWE